MVVTVTVEGTPIIWSQDPAQLEWNISMDRDHDNTIKIPTGFDLLRELVPDPASCARVFPASRVDCRPGHRPKGM